MDTAYTPNPGVLQALTAVDAVIVVGPTAVGKSTLIDKVTALDPTVRLVCSTVSRPPRPGEQEGVDLHFRSVDEMRRRIAAGEYVQYVSVFTGDLYATAPEDYAAQGISLLPIVADAVPVFRALPFGSMRVVYVLPPSFAAWQARMTHRRLTPEQWCRRLEEAARSFAFAVQDTQAYYVVNDEADVAAEQLLAVVRGNATGDPAGKQLAEALLQQLAHAKTAMFS